MTSLNSPQFGAKKKLNDDVKGEEVNYLFHQLSSGY